jgi:hypothetical protein
MLKKFLSIGLILATAAAAAVAAPATFAPTTVAEPAAACTATAARPAINCGFICDSFGRCRRVCW